MTPVEPNDFFSLRATSSNGENFGYVLKHGKKPLSIMEKAYLAALFEMLAMEYTEKLRNQLGDEKAYLLMEYQKLSIVELRAIVEEIKQRIDESLRSKGLGQALDYIKDANKDLEGFSEGDQAE